MAASIKSKLYSQFIAKTANRPLFFPQKPNCYCILPRQHTLR